MDHLFFDIECADGSNICSFGYIIVDEKFNVIDKKDILIDPECAFKLGRAGFDGRIHLAYTPDEFREHPPYSEMFDGISALLTAPDRVLWGHAISSDIEYLDIANARYGKKRFDIAVYDTQKIYADIKGATQKSKLEKIMEECEIDVSHLTAHKSSDDAEMSMLTVKKICEYKNCAIAELTAQSAAARVDRATMDKAYRYRQLKKTIEHNKTKYRREYRVWESIYFPDIVDKFEIAVAEKIIDAVFDNCYELTLRSDKCDYCVTDEVRGEIGLSRPECKIVTYAELSEMLNVDIDRNGNISKRLQNAGSSFGELLEKALNGKRSARKIIE